MWRWVRIGVAVVLLFAIGYNRAGCRNPAGRAICRNRQSGMIRGASWTVNRRFRERASGSSSEKGFVAGGFHDAVAVVGMAGWRMR